MPIITDVELAIVDNMFCRDMTQLAALDAPEELAKRRDLRKRVLAMLDGEER